MRPAKPSAALPARKAMVMTTEENKAIVRRYQEIYNTNRLDELPQVLAPEFKPHTLMPGVPASLEGYKMVQNGVLAAFPDFHVSIEDLIAEGDKVAMRFLMTGTHEGAFMGAPATGVKIHVTGISIFRLAGGQIVEHWGEEDSLGWMQQVGALPKPG
jgi:steroid delta-isomerase-like uncharacterized protein